MTKSGSAAARQAPMRHARSLALIFAVLGILVTALVALHWFLVLEPALRTDAKSHSQVLAQAQASSIEQHLAGSVDTLARRDLETALDGLLLLRDQATGLPFVRRISLAINDEYGDGSHSGLEMARGVEHCPDCFVSSIPLYHPQDRQLIGIATFDLSRDFMETMIEDFRVKLLWGAGFMLCFIALAWLGTARLLRRLSQSEANLRNLFEAAPYPMVLHENGHIGLSHVNQAAKDYLALRQDGAGGWSSDAWRALAAAGLPRELAGQRETAIPTADGGERCALISTIPVQVSNVLGQLVSLVDVSEIKANQRELERTSATDSLTGLWNRRFTFQTLAEESERARRFGSRFSIILFDLDHFKAVNDTFGHRVGDAVLTKVAAELLDAIRDGDIAGRYGGEEFLVILPYTGAAEALNVGERIRTRIKALAWPEPGLRVTISGGIAEYRNTDVDALVDAADRKLYEAKAAGRDRVVG
jgi:diguanylate cyclase (GGDEF)-like protein